MEKAGIKEIMTYFGTKERPVTPPEFRAFWQELSDAEKDFYKQGIGEILGL